VERLAQNTQIAFCFVGGGSEFQKVKEFAQAQKLESVLCLPYQPLSHLSAALSAADLHVVVMGNPFVGIVHPCKIYNIMSVGIPVLYIGPSESPIADLLRLGSSATWAYLARNGEVESVVERILAASRRGPTRSEAETQIARRFAQEELIPRMTGLVTGTRTGDAVSDRLIAITASPGEQV
jgi:hypothetical protein